MAVLSKSEMCEKIKMSFQSPEMKYRPYIRWWLAEGSHSDKTLSESVEEIYNAGIGGIEFVTLDESDYLSDHDFAWGSKMWDRTVETIVRECGKRNMSVSMSGGTHWATVNLPDISPDDPEASHELVYTVFRVSSSVSDKGLSLCRLENGVTKQTLVCVIAAAVVDDNDGNRIILDPDRMFDITANVRYEAGAENPTVSFQRPDDAEYLIFAFYLYGTGEYFKPSVAGKNYTVNYLDQRGARAVQAYWKKYFFTPEMKELISGFDECDFYMDSLELSTLGKDSTKQLWAEDLPEEFLKRRGYDLVPYIPFLIRTTPDGIEGMGLSLEYWCESNDPSARKIRNDFYQTLTELYEERFLIPIRQWLHKYNIKLRAETSYGKTFEISQPIRSVDYVETENFES